MIRCFVALRLEGPAHEAAIAVQDRLREVITRQGVRFVAPAKLHLTLRFLGNVPEEDVAKLDDSLGRAGPCVQGKASLRGIGAFPSENRPKVIWLGVEGAWLDEAARKVAEATAIAADADPKPFAPHVTLARVNPGSKEVGWRIRPIVEELRGETLAEWVPSKLVLMRTMPDGSYEALGEYA